MRPLSLPSAARGEGEGSYELFSKPKTKSDTANHWPFWKRRVAMANCPPGGPSTAYPPGRSRRVARKSPERLQTAHRLATGRHYFQLIRAGEHACLQV